MMAVELGDEVKDPLSGFAGVVIGVTTWLHGCRRISVQPRGLKDGKPAESHSFDEPQLEVLSRGAIATGSRETGGPTCHDDQSPKPCECGCGRLYPGGRMEFHEDEGRYERGCS